jgi:hypothetical protein
VVIVSQNTKSIILGSCEVIFKLSPIFFQNRKYLNRRKWKAKKSIYLLFLYHKYEFRFYFKNSSVLGFVFATTPRICLSSGLHCKQSEFYLFFEDFLHNCDL